MAWSVSETFRRNCYDDSKKQRMTFVSEDGVVLTNEDISAENSVKFNLTSIKSDQIMFGEMNGNTISLTILNDDRRIQTSDIYPKEFKCYIGVEVSDDQYSVPENAISAVSNNKENISVYNEAPYIRGNIEIGNTISQLEHGWACKIALIYDRLYFVVDDGTTRYFARHLRLGDFKFGDYETPSDLEIANLNRLMDDPDKSGISYFKTGFAEYKYHSTHNGVMTWGDCNNITWSDMNDRVWGYYSGYTIFDCILYEAVPYGVWHFDRPRRINSAILTLNGKDRMVYFDEDCKAFVDSISHLTATNAATIPEKIARFKNIPYVRFNPFLEYALNALVYQELLYLNEISFEGKSLKDLMSYTFEVGASNGIIDREGKLSCLSKFINPIALPFVYSFDVADSISHTIGKVLVYAKGDYVLYQEDNTVENGVTYEWRDNPFFVRSNPTDSWFSTGAHKKYGNFHNAITVSDCDYSIWCDDMYSWEEDGITYIEPIYTMSVEWNGFGRVTYTNSGEESRQYDNYGTRIEAVSSVNDNNLYGFKKATSENKLEFNEYGLTINSRGLIIKNNENDNVLYTDENGDLIIKGQLSAASGNIGKWLITDKGLYCNKADTNYGLEIYDSGLHFRTNDQYELAYIVFQEESDSIPRHLEFMVNSSNNVDSEIWLTSKNVQFRTSDITVYGNISFEGSNSEFRVKDGTVRFDNSIWLNNIPTTTSASNTTLVSGNYGYRVHRVSSLRALKDNIKTIENASEKVDNLRGVSFTSKCEADDPNVTYYGFIAEEVEKAVPELASYEDDKLQSVQYDRVCALLVEDNKACHRRIEELERRLEELERRLSK